MLSCVETICGFTDELPWSTGLFHTAAAEPDMAVTSDSSAADQPPSKSEPSAAAGSPFSDLTSPEPGVPAETMHEAGTPIAERYFM